MSSEWSEWLLAEPSAMVMVMVSTIVVYAAVIAYTRFFGLRTFSKMSAFDFAMTIALGSLFASSISSPSPPILLSLFAFLLLFSGQKLIAIGRRSTSLKHMIDNDPILLMVDGRIVEENLRRTNVTRGDLLAKLREANVLDFLQVKAVVFETTGDVSVLHGDPDEALNPALLEGVRRDAAGT